MATATSNRKRQPANGSKPTAQPAEATVDLDISAEPEGPAAETEQLVETEQKPGPRAELDVAVQQVPQYRPTVTVVNDDGTRERIACPHTSYGHETEKQAQACGRRLASQRGARIDADEK